MAKSKKDKKAKKKGAKMKVKISGTPRQVLGSLRPGSIGHLQDAGFGS